MKAVILKKERQKLPQRLRKGGDERGTVMTDGKNPKNLYHEPKDTVGKEIQRIILVVIASVIFAANLNSFVHAGNTIPGGFTGLTLLIQRIASEFFGVTLPYSAVNFILNVVPAVVAFKTIGKKFTLYSCLGIFLTGIFTDMIPSAPLTNDILLISIFGGLINGVAICIFLRAGATSGGTDFIAIYMSEKKHVDTWNYVLAANAVMLIAAGFLFDWNDALYSIIFQFTSTQMIQMFHLRYKKHTLIIITDRPEEIYEEILAITNHGATFFKGIGGFEKEERTMVYSVVSSEEVKKVVHRIRKIDSKAFVNTLRTDQIDGRFYQRKNN